MIQFDMDLRIYSLITLIGCSETFRNTRNRCAIHEMKGQETDDFY